MLEQNAIDRAKIALGVRTDVDLAKTLNIAQSAVAGWRKRGMVPQEQAVKIAQMTGVSLDWLILGRNQPHTGVVFYSAPDVRKLDIPLTDKIRMLSDWHIEQLRELTLEQAVLEQQEKKRQG